MRRANAKTLEVRPFIKRAAANVRGNVALIVAICAPVLVGLVGFATDYGYATYVNQGLQSAADAAVLAATSQSAATAGGGYGNTAWLTSYGTNVFQGNIAKLPVSNVTPNLSVVSNGGNGVIATASYSYPVPTFISGIIGLSTITVKGSAQAAANPLTYINYYILVDISQSMGVATTPSDMTTLYNRVAAYGNGTNGETGCVFGCHVTSPGQTYSNEQLAHNFSPKVTLRIDSAVAAIQSVIAAAQQAAGTNQNIKIGLYTMSKNPNNGVLLTTVSAPSSNYASLNTLAASIDLGDNNGAVGFGDSDFANQLTQFNASLPTNGSGASAVSPLNYVFIITDGMDDVPGSCPGTHCTAAFSPSNCANTKAKSTVGVIYTTYAPIYYQNNPSLGYEFNYSYMVAPYVGQVLPNLQACASSSKFFYQASDGPGITAGMQALFTQAQQTPVLTK